MQTRKTVDLLILCLVVLLTFVGAGMNLHKQRSVDKTKLPAKVDENKGFHRWITNLKNKGLTDIEADEFELLEENEIYNTKWIRINSIDEPGKKEEYEAKILSRQQEVIEGEDAKPIKGVAFSPSEEIFIDYRNIGRDGYKPNEVQLYGLKEDKIVDARIVDCSERANCYFDRGYFLSNDLLVVTEFSRNFDKKAEDVPVCNLNDTCTYTIKLHMIDLINNKRLVYESDPLDIALGVWIPEL